MSGDTEGWVEKLTMDKVPYYFNERTEEVSWDKPNALKSKDELYSESGRWRWLPDPVLAWIPGREVSKNSDGTVECVNERGDTVVLKKNTPDWPLMKSSLLHLEEDLVLVDNMNEGLIIHNLRERFARDQIYTNIGTILVSVNPFKRLPLYTPSMMETYYKTGGNKRLPPHIFGIADAAYKSMIYDKANQSILISGESGAGKTEATKQCLAFFAEIAGSDNNVEQRIIQANPILEAFGNAKTVRNNNSSRFGKYMEIHFDKNGKIVGARTENYLLEKSRVVYQAPGERNFHIFYQLVLGDDRAKYFVDQPLESFNYLNQSGVFDADDVDDTSDYNEVLSSLKLLGFSTEEIDWLFRTTAAILLMGNIEIDWTADELGSKIQNLPLVKQIASLLQVDFEKLKEALLSRWFVIRGQEPTKIPFKPDEARDACDALAKAIYGNLFDWLVTRINQAVAVEAKSSAQVIGVLDIFGFEIFETNSFEQLCINFANEKLQQHFNQYTFKLEEKVYANERIDFVHIEFIDNQPILDMIEKKPNGLLILLDEEIVMPKGSDLTWSHKIVQCHNNNDHFEKIIKKDTAFMVHHYAGAVCYDAEGFLAKNRDTLYEDLHQVMAASTHKITKSLFTEGVALPGTPDANKTRKKVSLGGQFRLQLNNLMDKLNQTKPHYVRCVKPNSLKEANNFQSVMSLEQLRYAGVFEAIRIRQQGFPFRYTHREFVRRYKCLALQENGSWLPLKSRSDKELCKELLQISKQEQTFASVQIGVSQVLYRAPQQRVLELLRNLALERVCRLSQAWIRRMLAQLFARRLKQARPQLRQALQVQHDLGLCKQALHNAHKIIGTLINVFGFQLLEITQCKELQIKLEERKRVSELLAIVYPLDPEKNFDQLSDAVAQADAIADLPANPEQWELYENTKALLELTINRRATRQELTDAVEIADKYRIEAAIEMAKELEIESCQEVQTGRKMLERIAKEEIYIQQLTNALQSGGIVEWSEDAQQELDLSGLDESISNATKFGMKTKEGIFYLFLANFTKKLRRALASAPWDGSDPWTQVDELFAGVEQHQLYGDENVTDDDDARLYLLGHMEPYWAYQECLYRQRVREMIDPLTEELQKMNVKNMQKILQELEQGEALGDDQLARLQQRESELKDQVQSAIELLKQTKKALDTAIETEDEDQLQQAIAFGEECGLDTGVGVHLHESFVIVNLLLALKFHIVHGEREQVGLMLDEVLASATKATIRDESEGVFELHKDAILAELQTQSEAIHAALALADHLLATDFKTDVGVSTHKKAIVIQGLRDNLLARNWDLVESFLNQASSLHVNTADVQLARDEVAGRAAAEDVLASIEAACADIVTPSSEEGHPSEGILQTRLAQAERLQMKELPQIAEGRALYNRILECRTELDEALVISQYDDYVKLAEEFGSLYRLFDEHIQRLKSSISTAESFSYETKQVADARHLLEEIQILYNIQTALQTGAYLDGDQPQAPAASSIQLDALTNAYGPTDGFDLSSDLSHYIVTKAYHLICIRGAIQVLCGDYVHLKEAVNEANEGLAEFDTPELISARELLSITEMIVARMKKAEEDVEQGLLEEAVSTAEQYFYENENVERVRQLRDKVIELNEESRQALWNMDKDRMQAVIDQANQIRLSTPHFDKIQCLLNLSEDGFLKLEIKKAKELQDEARKIRIAIRLKEITLDTFGNMFNVLQCKSLRSGKDFANLKLVSTDRKKLATGMMFFSKNPIHTSLTDLPDPVLIKLAKKCFKNILGYMTDKKYPFPSTCAQELIQIAIDNPGVRGEVYVQIIKQIAEHPIPANKQRGYHLLALCCRHFPSSPDFENFLEMYLRNVPEASSKYIAALRDSQYGGASSVAPNADQIDSFVEEFFNPQNPTGQSRFCVPQPLKTSQYTDAFFDNPEEMFLKVEVDD